MADPTALTGVVIRVLARLVDAVRRIATMRDQEAAIRALERLEKHAAQIDADAIAQDEVGRMIRERDRDDA
jgi:uncharacterized protein YbjQ (UPF0145 family)